MIATIKGQIIRVLNHQKPYYISEECERNARANKLKVLEIKFNKETIENSKIIIAYS